MIITNEQQKNLQIYKFQNSKKINITNDRKSRINYHCFKEIWNNFS